jgi:hypothetical protein
MQQRDDENLFDHMVEVQAKQWGIPKNIGKEPQFVTMCAFVISFVNSNKKLRAVLTNITLIVAALIITIFG